MPLYKLVGFSVTIKFGEDTKKPLKIISVYSDNDIPANAVYKKKSDEPQE